MKEFRKGPQNLMAAIGAGTVEALFYFPFLLFIDAYLLPDRSSGWWLASLVAVYAAASLLPGKAVSDRKIWRWLLALAIGGVHALLALTTLGEAGAAGWIVCPVAAAWMAERGFARSRLGWGQSFPSIRMLSCLLAYIALLPLQLWLYRLADYQMPIYALGIVAIFTYLFLANERHLNAELIDNGKSSVSQTARRNNRLIVLLLAVVTLLVVFFRSWQEAVEQVVRSALGWLFGLFRSGDASLPESTPTDQPMQPMLPPTEASAQPAWLEWLTQAIFFAVMTALALAALVGAWLLLGKLYRLLRRLLDKLTEREGHQAVKEASYADHVENVMTLMKWRRAVQKDRDPRKEIERWNDTMSNSDKIRFLYRKLLRDAAKTGFAAKPHLTPRETVGEVARRTREEEAFGDDWRGAVEAFAASYEEARYGLKEPSDEAIGRHKRWTEQAERAQAGRRQK